MDVEGVGQDVVHPEVRAHINSLASALGGLDEDGVYKLGDDALECLRDIKKWIRFYDEKTNRMDVARCLAESNLVAGDLLPILATWTENTTSMARLKERAALACFEILVPLTWPLDGRDAKKEMTVNHHRHVPVLQLAQVGYKRDIINYDAARVLHSAIRVALPSMALPAGDRSARDQAIIKLVLYFLRNIAMLAPPPGVNWDGDESQISRSATIDAFSYQDVFLALLTIASNMGEDFRTEDVVLMEIIYHLVKRVNVQHLFMDEQQLTQASGSELENAMKKEAAMLRSYHKPTRHNRFGTMVWVKRDDGKMSVLSGQQALVDPSCRNRKLDSTKTFRPPRRAVRKNEDEKDLGLPVKLNARATKQLREFVEDFLDSGFNPLFQHLRKSIDREASHVLQDHHRQFFYLVSWFLEAEQARQKFHAKTKPKTATSPATDDVTGFNLVAGVLNQEMFITLSRSMSRSYDEKDWAELAAAMKCFTQILLTIQEMTESQSEDDQEIAENMLNRLFYEEATHDLIANIARGYVGQGFEYLDATTDLVHHYLRILESYSKQNVDMQVRSKRRTRRRKKRAAAEQQQEGGGDGPTQDDGADDSANEQDDARNAERTSRERKFDFGRFAARFSPQGVIDTFLAFTRHYRDLNEAQLKRTHRFLYRVAFKMDMSVMLFRVDTIYLLHDMIKGPEPLDRTLAIYKEWEELAKHVIRKCIKKFQEREALVTEMLFSKINSTVFFLDHGYEPKAKAAGTAKPGAELEFRHILEREQQIAILVGVLLDKNLPEHLNWVKSELTRAEAERRIWELTTNPLPLPGPEGEAVAESAVDSESPKEGPLMTVRPDSEQRRTAMFKNPHLRLLMAIVGMRRLAPLLEETPDCAWVFDPVVTADQFKESLAYISRAEFAPPTFDDGKLAEDQLRRKSAVKPRAKKTDGVKTDSDDDDGEEEFLFPEGGPTARTAIDGEPAKKKTKKLRRRKRGEDGEEHDDLGEAQREARAAKRAQKELERKRKIKSDLYVHASDDEDDEDRDRDFFAREAALRDKAVRAAAENIISATLADDEDGPAVAAKRKTASNKKPGGERASKKRKAAFLDDEDDSASDSDGAASDASTSSDEGSGGGVATRDDDDEESTSEPKDTPPSSSHPSSQTGAAGWKRRKLSPAAVDAPSSSPGELADREKITTNGSAPMEIDISKGDDDDDDQPVFAKAARARPRARNGFLDSSDEE